MWRAEESVFDCVVNSRQYKMYFGTWKNETNPPLYTIRNLSEKFSWKYYPMDYCYCNITKDRNVKSNEFRSWHFEGPILCRMNVSASLQLAPPLRRNQLNVLFWKIGPLWWTKLNCKMSNRAAVLALWQRAKHATHGLHKSFFHGLSNGKECYHRDRQEKIVCGPLKVRNHQNHTWELDDHFVKFFFDCCGRLLKLRHLQVIAIN